MNVVVNVIWWKHIPGMFGGRVISPMLIFHGVCQMLFQALTKCPTCLYVLCIY